MDGINPTLAFAALFFGLSGNAHHATQDQQLELQSAIDCPVLTITGDPAPSNLESWIEALQDSPASAYALPRMTEPTPEDTALAKDQSDPIPRWMVPAAAQGPAADSAADPCAPER